MSCHTQEKNNFPLEKPLLFRPCCAKHGEFFVHYKDGLVVQKDGFIGHFHADLVGCPKTHCIRILIFNTNECFCPRQPISPEKLRQLIKQSRC